MYYLYALDNNNWVNILPNSNNLSWSSDKDTLGVELNFESIYDMLEGTIVVLKNDNNGVFTGIITNKTKGKFVNTYKAMDFAFYLNKSETIIQFNNVSASTAIRQLLSKFEDIESDIVDISTNINKIYKDQTLSSIIDDILEQAQNELGIKFIKEMQGYTLVIRKLEDMIITPKLLIEKDPSLSISIENLKNSVLVVSNEEENNNILISVKDDNSIARFGLLQEVISVDDKNEAQARNIANNYLAENNKVTRDFSFNAIALEGGDDIRDNRMLNINFPSMAMVGLYRIKSVSHNLKNNRHHVSITIG